jgi:lysozyme family protein
MPTEVESFLRAEDAVNALLLNVDQLKTEVEGYARAKTSLEDVRSQLSNVIRSLGSIAEQTVAVVQAMEKVGTPQILHEMAALTTLNERSLRAVDSMEKGLESSAARLEAHHQRIIGEIKTFLAGALGQTKAQGIALQESAAQNVAGVKQQVELLGATLAEQVKMIQAESKKQAASIKRMLGAMMLAVVVASVAVFYFTKGF